MKQYATRRAALKAIATNQSLPMEERFKAHAEAGEAAAQLLGDAAAQPLRADRAVRTPITASCTARRIMLRDLASFGQIPGMVKSSW